MKIFECGNCNHAIYFENIKCENCGHLSGYRDTDRKMLTFSPSSANLISDRENKEYKYCKNNSYNACNWLIEKKSQENYCSACRLNRTIPNLSKENSDNLENWQNMEIAKHRLIYQLQKLGFVLKSKLRDKENGLCFDFVEKLDNAKLMTGHANGVVTILIKEGDSAKREYIRKEMLEPYRTLVGHLRHEVGHYFWNQLIRDVPKTLLEFRTIFGNETKDYGKSLDVYYKNGAPINWQQNFISKYATSHPWEDWAETWAHYLHIMDMVETAYFFKLNVKPKSTNKEFRTKVSFDPFTKQNFNVILRKCIPLTFAVNSMNRSMGISDIYPFVISPKIVEKLNFIHQLLLPLRKLPKKVL